MKKEARYGFDKNDRRLARPEGKTGPGYRVDGETASGRGRSCKKAPWPEVDVARGTSRSLHKDAKILDYAACQALVLPGESLFVTSNWNTLSPIGSSKVNARRRIFPSKRMIPCLVSPGGKSIGAVNIPFISRPAVNRLRNEHPQRKLGDPRSVFRVSPHQPRCALLFPECCLKPISVRHPGRYQLLSSNQPCLQTGQRWSLSSRKLDKLFVMSNLVSSLIVYVVTDRFWTG